MKVKPQIQELLKCLNEGIYEKEEVMRLALLSTIAGESLFMIGAPGVAKSLIARRLKYAFEDGKSFEYLMNRFSTPDEIFGPVSITKLKEGVYERMTDDYLPGATVVFLDEIWKAGPSIQNALLTVLNEKVYRNGAQEIKLPMKAIIAASNELPAVGEGLEALWDRFLIRLEVGGISEQKAFNEMIATTKNAYANTVGDALKITHDSYTKWQSEINNIKVPENVFQVIQVMRNLIQKYNEKQTKIEEEIYVSDRRWRKIIRILRTSAFLNDRKEVDLMDCFLIGHCIWNDTEQIELVGRFLRETIEKFGYKLSVDLEVIDVELKDLDKEVLEETSFLKPIQKSRLKVYEKAYYKVVDYNDYYVRIDEFGSLSPTMEKNIKFYKEFNGQFRHESNFSCKHGNKKETIIIIERYNYGGTQYSFEEENYEQKIKATRKPHKATKKHFDEKVASIKELLLLQQLEVENFRTNDLKHLKVNLFVEPALAKVVESNLNILEKEIRQLDIEADRIKAYYENIKDGEIA